MDAGGNLSIQGTSPCSSYPEVIAPYCSGGTVWFDYYINDVTQGPNNTGVACGALSHLSVYGNGGADTLDLLRVSAANGFTGINRPNLIDGGYGNDTLIGGPLPSVALGRPDNDIILVRNGVRDAVDCGNGIDEVQTDPRGVDSLANCEIVDFAAASRTGRQATALKKCRHKHGKAKKRCKKKAHLLPV